MRRSPPVSAAPAWWLAAARPFASYRPLVRELGRPLACVCEEGEDAEAERAGLRPIRLGDAGAVIAAGGVVLRPLAPGVRGLAAPAGGAEIPRLPLHLDGCVGPVWGEALDPEVGVEEARRAVDLLASDAWIERAPTIEPLHRTFRRAALARDRRPCLIDGPRSLTRFQALVGAVLFARALRREWSGQERVGILLPPSLAGVLANLAAAFAGKVAVNLNYTLGADAIASCARQAGLRTVLTSRRFLGRLHLELPDDLRCIHAEEVHAGIGSFARLSAAAAALLLPNAWLERWCGARKRPRNDDVLALLFSSGSTAEPKGVPLTHANIEANVRGALEHVDLHAGDCVLGILPLFHSFGTTILWVVLLEGLAIALQPDPLDGDAVGELVERHRVGVLVATPTFLQLYLRKIDPARMASVRLIIAGAERLAPSLADRLAADWSCSVVEGYGTTECSPIVAVGSPGQTEPAPVRPATPRGSVGRPLPGVALRLSHSDAEGPDEPPQAGQPGLLWVRGASVFGGYLGRPDLTRTALRQGWYRTGDLARFDEDGNLYLCDRLSRFSKIGGEMVPHGLVEDTIQGLLGAEGQEVLVTAVEDAKKGESLVVLYSFDADRLDAVQERLRHQHLPPLFVPRPDRWLRVPSLPLLGTGKLDLRAARAMATERFGTPK